MTTDWFAKARVYDLAQEYFPGMPHHPTHPPFLYGLVKQHGEYRMPSGNSSASDALALGSHNGTHMDALSHFSCGGKLHGGIDAASAQSYQGGMRAHSAETIAPVLRRGVLLDFAAAAPLAADREITPADLDAAAQAARVEIHGGDVVLLRTGWAQYFHDAAKFVAEVHGPGPSLAGARWLSERKIFAAGSDTLAFEKVPDPDMPVHIHLLVESGIHIIECLDLEQLAADRVYEFTFIAAPLKIKGATGAPVRPLAIA